MSVQEEQESGKGNCMSQKYCYQIGEWVNDNVSQQVEQCVEQDCDWWCACCNKWLCGLVWIIVTVAKWVVTTVCEILGDIVDLVVSILKGLWDIFVGIFTWNWSRVWDGLMEIVGGIGGILGDLIRAVTLCGLIGEFRDSINKWRLRGYVQDLIDKSERFTDQDRQQIKDALQINGSGFGLRLVVQSYRGFVRSDYVKPGDTIPALVRWNSDTNPDTRVDLKVLAGFKWNKFFERGRPDVRGDNSESDIDAYLADPSSRSFSIYAMSDSVQLDKLHAVQIKGDTIGLKLEIALQDVQFTEPTQVRAIASSPGVVSNLAAPPFSRAQGTNNPDAITELCSPIVVGTFLFQDNGYVGYSAHLRDCTCVDGSDFPPNNGTGAEYRDRLPDWAFTYVPIHELGHTFGLCHVDGLDRIMVSTRDHSWWSLGLLPEYICFSGEPQFVYDEAKKVWDYIIANFAVDCLANRTSIG